MSAESAPEPLSGFCDRLRRLKRTSGITQRALARTVGVSEQQLSDILNGKIRRLPPWPRVQAMVEACRDHAAANARSLPPDIASADAWRSRYFDLEQDLDVSARTPIRSRSTPLHGYLAQMRDIAPDQLHDRDAELADLARFCAADEPYTWWQAPPWAGKSALAATFAGHPPGGVDVAAFFVTARLSTQSDSDAFTAAITAQLAALLGEDLPDVLAGADQAAMDAKRRELLDRAADSAVRKGRRLLLVVDGLDEDQGVRPGSGLASIAALLPRRPPPGLRVLVTSRPHPGIPADVPGDHPLRTVVPRMLMPSPYARDIERLATQELIEQLHRGPDYADVAGFLAASGDALTLTDLAELTGQPPYQLRPRLESAFGRSLITGLVRDSEARVFAFAHDTLRALATDQFGRELARYIARIREWAGRYRAAGWPEDTPRYLLHPYWRMVSRADNVPELITLATDAARADRMRHRSYSDITALREITAAQQTLLGAVDPDLPSLSRLAVHRHRLRERTLRGQQDRPVPSDLPVAFARLGDFGRAETLAWATPNPAGALARLCTAFAREGQWDHARRIADAIPDPHTRDTALADLASVLSEAGRWAAAEQATNAISRSQLYTKHMISLAHALANSGLWEEADRLVAHIELGAQAQALIGLLKALPDKQADRVPRMLGQIEASLAAPDASRTESRELFAELIGWLSSTGRWADAKRAARTAPVSEQPRRLRQVVYLLAQQGLYDEATEIARSAFGADGKLGVLTDLARSALDAHAEAGPMLISEAEQLISEMPDTKRRASALCQLATALAATLPDRAIAVFDTASEAIASFAHDELCTHAIGTLEQTARGVPSHVASGLADAADRIADRIRDPAARAEAVQRAATIRPSSPGPAGDGEPVTLLPGYRSQAALADQALVKQDGGEDQAGAAITAARGQQWQEVTRCVSALGPRSRAETLAAIAAEISATTPARAQEYIDAAEQLARNLPGDAWRADFSVTLAAAATRLDPGTAQRLLNSAEQLAETISDVEKKTYVLVRLLGLLPASDRPHATQLARIAYASVRSMPSGYIRANALENLIGTLAAAKCWEEAEEIALTAAVDEGGWGDGPLAALLRAAAATDPAYASRIAVAALTAKAGMLALGVSHGRYHTPAVTALAAALARAGLRNDAGRVISCLPVASDRLKACLEVIRTTGDPDGTITAAAVQIIEAAPGRPEWRSASALVDLSHALAQAGLWEEAERITRTIPLNYSRDTALIMLAEALLGHHRLTEAERITGDITDYRRHKAFITLTRELCRQGHWLDAERVAGKAEIDLADGDAHAALVDEMISAGRLDDAARIANAITRPTKRPAVLGKVTAALISNGYWDEAERAIAELPSERHRLQLRATLASQLAEAEPERARRIADTITRDLLATTNGLEPGMMFTFAAALAHVDIERAMQLMDSPAFAATAEAPGSAKANAQAAVGAALVRRMRWQDASHVLQGIPPTALGNLIQRLTGAVLDKKDAARLAELAGQLCSGVDDPARKAEIFLQLAQHAAGARLGVPTVTRLTRLAEITADQVSDDTRRCWIWSQIAKTIAGYDPDAALKAALRAETAAHSIDNDKQRQNALDGTIFALAKTGHTAHAKTLADSFPAYQHALALAALAKATAESSPIQARGYAAEAEVLIDDVASREEQISAWTVIGCAVAAADPAYAEELAGKAQARVLDDADWGPSISVALALAETGVGNSSNGIPSDASPEFDFSGHARWLIRLGRWKEAERVASEYRDDDSLGEHLAWGLVDAGRWKDAERVARNWPKATPQIQLAASAAQLHLTNGAPEHEPARMQARREAAKALASTTSAEDLARTLQLLAIVDTTAVQAAATEVLSLAFSMPPMP